MQDSEVLPLHTDPFKPATLFFSALETKQKLQEFKEYDDYVEIRRKPFHSNPNNAKQPQNREVIETLMITDAPDAKVLEAIDAAIKAGVTKDDLPMLSDVDLQLFGYENPEDREYLLHSFSSMFTKQKSFEAICSFKRAKYYNSDIIRGASDQLHRLGFALEAACHKYIYRPPTDVLMGEKRFASQFVLDALEELSKASDELGKELKELQAVSKIRTPKPPPKIYKDIWIMLGLVATCACLSAGFWKLQN